MRLHRASSRTSRRRDAVTRARGGSDGERDRVVVAPRPGVAQRPRRATDRPGDPRRDRDPADRLHARPRRRRPAGARRAVRGPGVAARHPRPLPGAHAGVPGRAARRPRGAPPGPAGRRRGPARGLADLRDALAAVPRDAHALLARARLRRGVRAGRAARRPTPPTGSSTCSSERLEKPAFRPLALFDEFGIEILATTDAATATLADHADLAERGWGDRIVPTFRPDALLHVDRPGWRADVALLEERSGVAIDSGTATWCARSRSVGARSSPPVRAPRTTGTSPRTRPR